MINRHYVLVCFLVLACCGYVLDVSSSPLFDSQKISKEFSLYANQEGSTQMDQSEENTRQSIWDAEREKKSASLKPNKMSWIEKFLDGFGEEGGLGLNWKGIYPRYGGMDSGGAGITLGARYWRRDLFGTPLEFQVQSLYSIRKYQQHSIQFGKIMRYDVYRLIGTRGYGGLHNFRGLDRKDYNFFLFGAYRYRDLVQEDFFGMGPDSQKENRTDFRQKDSTVLGTIAYRFTSWAVVAAAGGYMSVDISEGKDSRFPDTQVFFDNSTAPGLFENADFVIGGGTFVLDFRDQPSNPHSGFMFGFEHVRYDDFGATNFSFGRTSYDIRGYLPLFAEHRTLAFQLYTSMNNPDSGNVVPFYMMETLGGHDALRGFNTFRFRDENLISLSVEYRWEAAPFWELALFYDSGKVFPNGSDWNLKDLEKGYGIGTRFKLPKTVLLRIDVGHSREGTHFYFRLSSPSF